VDDRARDKLVEDHLELARKIARMIYPRVREHMAYEDVVAIGQQGLVEAATRFDATKGATFTTFAWYRINGAILDAFRRNANLPRRVWTKLVALRAASEYLEHQSERERGARDRSGQPVDRAEALAALRRAMAAIRTVYVTSLETLAEDKGFEPKSESPDPAAELDTRKLAARLRKALDKLPAKERELVTKHYWEGKNLLEAGAELGISKSWASRLHGQAVDRLRQSLEDDPE
jgi:RNA polymerase sigma factor for flagellar operon FliA